LVSNFTSVQALLHFIYKDTLIEDEELHFSVPSTMTSLSKLYVTKLLAAAHKYQLPRLKLMCESVLCKHISINSVAQILIISDCYDAIQLKSICLRFSTENLEGESSCLIHCCLTKLFEMYCD